MKSNKQKNSTSLTIEEFKIWLSGLEAFQTEDWTPSKNQWKVIRDTIMSIKTPSVNDAQRTSNFNIDKRKQAPISGVTHQPQPFNPSATKKDAYLVPIEESEMDQELVKLPPIPDIKIPK